MDKKILIKKNKAGGLTLSDSRTSQNDGKQKSMGLAYQQTCGPTGQNGEPEISCCVNGQMIFNKDDKAAQ